MSVTNGRNEKSQNATDQSAHLIAMIKNTGQGSQAWSKFLITVQGAMAAAYAYLVTPTQHSRPASFLAIMVCILGIVISESLVAIIIRHHKWQAWFIGKYNSLSQAVFPKSSVLVSDSSTVGEMDAGYIGRIIRIVGYVLDLAWVIAIIISLVVVN